MDSQRALSKRLEALKETQTRKQAEKEAARRELRLMELKMRRAERIMQTFKAMGTVKSTVRAAGGFVLGRRNVKQLYSKAYRRKDAQNKLKRYTYRLYTLGFTEQALEALKGIHATGNPMQRRAAAWELALWYADQYTPADARKAFLYLPKAIEGTRDQDFLRRAAIIAAECAERCGMTASAINILDTVMAQHHPDIYLARANLEADITKRTMWINRAHAIYGIAPIKFEENTYEGLSAPSLPLVDGPKVTVIMPAYNAAGSIGTGIESVLSQTWRNIELLIVDDCSPDETFEVARQYAERDARVKVLTTSVNSGPYIARNLALNIATGTYVTVNDADDWSHPEKLETQVRHLMDHPDIIANTSSHARLTEELKLHRRGTPGTYLFSNMSSLMFRRREVLEHVGYWDNVRFAGDSEFKRRIQAVFGTDAIVDLDSGPLSFPRQASGSLTSSSAFGYKGFLMGVRREYAEVYRRHHKNTPGDKLRLPFEQKVRPYPVPEPMWIDREEKKDGYRHFDVIIISDFRKPPGSHQDTRAEILFNKSRGLRTGLVQMSDYAFDGALEIDGSVRALIDGERVQMLVYGEHAQAEALLIKDPRVFECHQEYVPRLKARVVRGVVDQPFKKLRQCARNASALIGKEVVWHPYDDAARSGLNKEKIRISKDNWSDYSAKMADWMIRDLDLKNQGR